MKIFQKHENEVSEEQGRVVVWPARTNQSLHQNVETVKTFQHAFKQANTVTSTNGHGVDQPHHWLQNQQQEEVRGGRVSRSNSRSRNIMERARSFERAAAETSRPGSRAGSGQRSTSNNRAVMEDTWLSQLERPASRTDVDSRRFEEIGRVHKTDWEQRIKGSAESLPTRTPPPKRREINMKRTTDTSTPEPPPPPTRMTYPANSSRDLETEFPPPPVSDSSSKLSEESVGQISEENKENIVKQWVESTTKSAEEIAKELEKFAYDIAETVVSNMEKGPEKKVRRVIALSQVDLTVELTGLTECFDLESLRCSSISLFVAWFD